MGTLLEDHLQAFLHPKWEYMLCVNEHVIKMIVAVYGNVTAVKFGHLLHGIFLKILFEFGIQ